MGKKQTKKNFLNKNCDYFYITIFGDKKNKQNYFITEKKVSYIFCNNFFCENKSFVTKTFCDRFVHIFFLKKKILAKNVAK